MNDHFLRLKRKNNSSIILKSLLYGISASLFFAGIFLLLTKGNILAISPLYSIAIGAFFGSLTFFIFWLVLRTNDEKLARELDRQFNLDERVQTMVDFSAKQDTLSLLQRVDTQNALSLIPTKSIKAKRMWISFLCLVLGVSIMIPAIITPNLQNAKPVEPVVPFELTELQRVGLLEIIDDVKTSKMQEPYRTEISSELEELLVTLEQTKTQNDMRVALGESMAYILEHTSSSSSMTEITTALWQSNDEYAKQLALTLDTSSWSQPNWGDFAEKYTTFKKMYQHVDVPGEPSLDEQGLHAELKWKLENSALKINSALTNSLVSQDDVLMVAIKELLETNYDDDTGAVVGFSPLAEWMSELSYLQSTQYLSKTFDVTTEIIYEALGQQKINTNVGELAMTKLSSLFLVPLPQFERPTLKDTNDGDTNSGNDGNQDQGAGGGIGGGAVFGSDDYVLDPSTGEYVKYGTLLAKYYALMSERLESGNYTEEQKQAIKKYFDILYSGID